MWFVSRHGGPPDMHVKVKYPNFRNAWIACGYGALACVLTTGKSFAADLPVKAPPLPYEYDWTGFYVGGTIGVATGHSNWNALLPGGAPHLSGSFSLYNS